MASAEQESTLEPFYNQATKMAAYWRGYENNRLAQGLDPWPVFNQNLQEVNDSFQSVLQGESLTHLAEQVRKTHGNLVALNIGSNNNPLEEIRQPGDVFIAVGLQDLRRDAQKSADSQRDSYFLAATIGDLDFWINKLDPLLSSLVQQGKIHNKYVNFLIGNLMLGWNSLPLSKEIVANFENETFSYPSQHPQESLRWRRKREFDEYFCWITNEGFNHIDPNGGIGLAEFPEEEEKLIRRWYTKQGQTMGAAIAGNKQIQVLIQRTPQSPSHLKR